MENLSIEFKLSQYTVVDQLNNKGNVLLVKDHLSGLYYIKKELIQYDLQIYKFLSENPHPSLVKIYDFFEYQDRLIVIEEFINGFTLQNIMEQTAAIEETELIRIILAVCDAVGYLHQLPQPLIHRDIKPENIMIMPDHSIKLIDFNISRFYKGQESKDTAVLGTAGYAAPEQFGFYQTDERSDIFSIGILMNYILTGHYPNEQIYQGSLTRIIKKCIQMEPNHRYQNVMVLSREIRKLIKDPKDKKSNIILKITWQLFWAVTGILYLIRYLTLPLTIPSVWGIMDRSMLIVTNMFLIALYGNFGKLQSYLPVCSSKKIGIRLLGFVIYYLLSAFIYYTVSGVLSLLNGV